MHVYCESEGEDENTSVSGKGNHICKDLYLTRSWGLSADTARSTS